MIAPLKTCRLCEAQLPPTEFHRCASTRDGLENRCKNCRRVLARQFYAEHRNEVLTRCADYYAEHRTEVLARVNGRNRSKKVQQKGSTS